MFMDTAVGWGFYTPNAWGFTEDRSGDGVLDSNGAVTADYNWAAPRTHNEGSNIVLADGHIEWMSFEKFQDPDNRLWSGRPGL